MMSLRTNHTCPPLLVAFGLLLALALVPEPGGAGPGDPVVGASATYRWTSSLTEEVPVLVQQPVPGGQATWSLARETAPLTPVYVTYSIVRADQKSYVLQIVTQPTLDGPPLSVTQVTVDRKSGKALKSVIQSPKGPIPTPESGLRPFSQAATTGATEEVAVPAGRFSAARTSYQNGTAWVSDRVPALGLVKLTLPNGQLELVKSGTTGAKDLLRS